MEKGAHGAFQGNYENDGKSKHQRCVYPWQS